MIKEKGDNVRSQGKRMLINSLIFIVCILVYNVFSIFIENYLQTFGVMVLFFTVIFLLGLIILSIIKITIDKQRQYVIYMVSSLISLCLITTQVFRSVGLNIDYNINKDERLKVVELLRSGAIIYNPYDEYIVLPSRYAHLSKGGGKIMIDEREGALKTCFFSSGGLFAKQDVVVYVISNDSLKNGDFGEKIKNIRKVEDHWFTGQMTP